jgi:methionyl-tRNA formyltransferase
VDRILFLGQKWLGEQCFDLLQSDQYDSLRICGVVSNVSTRVWWKSNKIYQHCMTEGIPFMDNNGRNNKAIKAMITNLDINIVISVQHPWILPPDILSLVNFNAFNLHNAKLPEYKGHNACNHAILNGERYYTSTLHWLETKVDTGAIAFEETLDIAPDDTARSLYEKALQSGQTVFRELLDHLLHQKPIPREPMVGDEIFYPRGSIDQFREIKDILDPDQVDKRARALFFPPFEPAYYLLSGRKHYVLYGNFQPFVCEFGSSWY